MSHYVDAKRMLVHPQIGPFLLSSLQAVFKDGYSLQKPNHPDDAPAVEVLVNDMTSEKALLLKVAMGIMEIDYFRPCVVPFKSIRSLTHGSSPLKSYWWMSLALSLSPILTY